MPPPASSPRPSAAENPPSPGIRCAVLVVSDRRTLQTDQSGRLIERMLAEAGHEAVGRRVVPNEPPVIRAQLQSWLAESRLQAIFTTGGTRIGPRETVIEVVRGLLTAELEGFGELFRAIRHEQIGSPAMVRRAVGGLVARGPDDVGDGFIFAMPGSPDDVETVMRRLILPQLAHLVERSAV